MGLLGSFNNSEKKIVSVPFSKSFFHTFGSRIIVLLISFFAGIIVARVLGPEKRGVLAVVVASAQIFSRIGSVLVAGNSILLGQNYERLPKLTAQTLLGALLISFFTLIIMIVLPGSIIERFFVKNDNNLIILSSVFIFGLIMEIGLRELLMARQEFFYINYTNIFSRIFYFVFILVFLLIFKYGLLFAAIVTITVPFFKVIFYLKNILNLLNKKLEISFDLIKKSVNIGGRAVITGIPIILLLKSDIWILSFFEEQSTVGIYQVSVSLCTMFLMLGQVLNQLVKAKAVSEEGGSERALLVSKLLFIIGIGVYIPLVLLGKPFFLFVYGKEYLQSYYSSIVLFIAIIFWGTSVSIGGYVVGKGKYPVFIVRGMILTLLINVMLNFALIPRIAEIGAAYASLVAYIIGTVFYFIKFIRSTDFNYRDLFGFNKNEKEQINNLLKKYLNLSFFVK